MYVFVIVRACCNVDVLISDAVSDEQAVSFAFKHAQELVDLDFDFDSIEIWAPSSTLIATLNF